ncbi:transcriptional regulator Ure2p [Monosporozyma servazzii]
MSNNFGGNPSQLSNLSNALRNVNLQEENNNNSNNNNSNNSNNNSNINSGNNNSNNENTTGPEQMHLRHAQNAINQNQNNIIPQQHHQLASDLSNVDNSRLVRFFQMQPISGYTLFSHRSAPNGFKVAIVLCELGLQFNTFFLDFNHGEHRAPEFISITPNARVPALIDHGMNGLSIWESGAILLHLVNKYWKETGDAKLWSENLADQSQINAWLFFQTTGHAPMIGQALHFRYFHSEKVPSALERYTDEVRRVYGVIEMALAERREALIMELDTDNAASYSAGTTPMSQSRFFEYPVWLCCDRITIADLSFVPWNNVVDRIGINIKIEFPEVYKWTKNMMRRPAVIKALRFEE